LLETEAHWRFL